MMKINLDKSHILNADGLCYWITTIYKSDKTGKDCERRVSGYHITPLDAINSFIDKKVMSSEATTVTELFKEVEELKKQVKKWKPKIEKTERKREK